MLVKGFLRLILNTNLCSRRLSFSAVNSLRCQSRFYIRNIHASANFIPDSENTGRLEKYEESSFRRYIVENNNFRFPIPEVMSPDFPIESKYDSLKLLAKLKENLPNDCLWREMLDCLNREISTFDVKDFLKIIALAWDVRINTGNQNFYSDFLATLDNELKNRKLELDDFLEILYVLRHTLFMGKSLKAMRFYFKLNRKFSKLHKYQPTQVIHMFYHLQELGETAKSMYKYPIVKYTKDNLSHFNAVEMGIIFSALHRAKLYVGDTEFQKQITDKVINEIESMESNQLFYVSKFLMNCPSFNKSEVVQNFQERLVPHISKFSAQALILALLMDYPNSISLSLWNSVVEKLLMAPKALNIVDIQRLISITTAFKVKDEELLKFIVEAIEEKLDLCRNSPHFTDICKHLVIHRIYPKKLLDEVLSKDFIDNIISRSFTKEMSAWGFLNCSLQLDKPEYQCICLDETAGKKIMKKLFVYTSFHKSVLNSAVTRVRLYQFLVKTFGDDKIIEKACLPHFDQGVIMRFDENLNSTPIPQEYNTKHNKIFRAPLDEHFWICVKPLFSLPEGLSPLQETYIRHMTVCGYKLVLVPEQEFHHYYNLDTEELKKYITNLIETKLKEVLKEKQNQK